MASQQPSKSRSVGDVAEPKPRGPNRTTKTAGKLKVLPEQPEPSTGPKSPRVARDFTASQSRTETSESEEEGDDEAEDEADADAEVRIVLSDGQDIDIISPRSTTNWTSYPPARPAGTLLG
jgi:hypothetical protein